MARSAKGKRRNTETHGPSVAKHPRSVKSAERTAILTHGNKREILRLKMHLERTKRNIKELRERLECWDEEDEEKKRQQQAAEPPRKKKRTDPSTWKLSGAARPACEVYDFDVRYVDPYALDHEKAKVKAKRQVNRLAQGNLGEYELGRTFLSLLMQLGSLSEEAKYFRDAKDAYIECMKLEGSPVTTARESLMRLYLRREKYSEVLELGESRSDQETAMTTSVTVTYSIALASFALQQNLEKPSKNKAKQITVSEEQVKAAMTKAIRSNIFLAYYIIHYDTFQTVMECEDELEQAADEDEPQSLLEEAIEYGMSDQMRIWKDLGANETLRSVLQTTPDIDWKRPLEELEKREQEALSSSKVDRSMFAGMFRTAMEMVKEIG